VAAVYDKMSVAAENPFLRGFVCVTFILPPYIPSSEQYTDGSAGYHLCRITASTA
jgi:hypothetical protein